MKRPILIILLLATIGLAQTQPKLEGSTVRYFASAGADKWSGVAPIETLSWDIDLKRPLETKFVATVRPAQFNSGNGIRDDNARNSVFKVARFPVITIRSLGISGDRRTILSGDTRQFKAKVRLELGGISQDLEIPIEIVYDLNDRSLKIESEFKVSLDAHKLERPEFLWLKTDDTVRLEVKFQTIL